MPPDKNQRKDSVFITKMDDRADLFYKIIKYEINRSKNILKF